ncbi:dodecin flavoprotein [Roseomonas sp. KE2513]|uniref:dodecin n=1 Tax=Roseomonas sp. KE2513 TaxID=2479202 RepID=UPI0018DF690C|nr:dodecin flavoprotein [Roseomonas sp. KE2513]
MEDHVYRLLELVGTSEESVSDAIDAAIRRAGTAVRNIRCSEGVQARDEVVNGKVGRYRVTLKEGFTLEKP